MHEYILIPNGRTFKDGRKGNNVCNTRITTVLTTFTKQQHNDMSVHMANQLRRQHVYKQYVPNTINTQNIATIDTHSRPPK
jgi:hypothetical protein